jgi:hypothetical protein
MGAGSIGSGWTRTDRGSSSSTSAAVDAGVINQGLFYLAWLMDHRAEFEHLVRDRMTAASQVLWSGPRLICIAGAHACQSGR